MAINDLIGRLENLDLDRMRQQALVEIRSGKKTRRQLGVKLLRAVDGLQRAGVKPADLVIRKVPVIPPQFRPYTTAGETFVPGDANELYSDLIASVKLHQDSESVFGKTGSRDTAKYVRNAVRAAYGYAASPNPKIKSRHVSGLLSKILGGNPKTSFVQQKLLAKPQDFVGRAVISPDPDLDMDHIRIPEDMAWNIFSNHLRRELRANGIPTSRALRIIQDRDPVARQALLSVMRKYPVLTSRAPAWHKHSVLGAWADITEGSNVLINPYITAGLGADFDGDTMAVHAPAMPEAIADAKEKIMPSKMLFSVRDRDSTLATPKHEMLLGLAASQLNPSGMNHQFNTRAEAEDALKKGIVRMHDQVTILDEE